jgi:hypothetical protein
MKGRCTISFIGPVRNAIPLISRGFHGRRRTHVEAARVPPGQYADKDSRYCRPFPRRACRSTGGCSPRTGPLASRASWPSRPSAVEDSSGTRRPRRQARTRRRVSTQGPPFPVIPFPDPSNSPPDNAHTVLNDEKCRPQIIEGSPGRPATKLLAAPPGPDESPSSKHRPVAARKSARVLTGANRPRSCDSDGT